MIFIIITLIFTNNISIIASDKQSFKILDSNKVINKIVSDKVFSVTDKKAEIPTAYTYGKIGRLISVTDAMGGITSYEYDSMEEKSVKQTLSVVYTVTLIMLQVSWKAVKMQEIRRQNIPMMKLADL